MFHPKILMCSVRCLLVVSFICIAFAFFTPYWLRSSGEPLKGRFDKIGLWTICWRNHNNESLDDPREQFRGCWPVYDKAYDSYSHFLRPQFYITTQISFSVCLVSLTFNWLLVPIHDFFDFSQNPLYKSIILFGVLGFTGFSALCGLIAVLMFNLHYDDDYWMPDHNYNGLSYSFAAAMSGVLLSFIASVCIAILIKNQKRPKNYAEVHQEQEASANQPHEDNNLI